MELLIASVKGSKCVTLRRECTDHRLSIASFCWIPLCSGIIPVNDSSLDRCWLIAFMGAIKQLFSSLTTTPGNAPTNCTYNCTHFKGNNTRTSSRAGRQAERKAEESPLTEPCSAIKPFFMAHFNPAEPWPAVLYCNWGRLNSFMQLFQATLFLMCVFVESILLSGNRFSFIVFRECVKMVWYFYDITLWKGFFLSYRTFALRVQVFGMSVQRTDLRSVSAGNDWWARKWIDLLRLLHENVFKKLTPFSTRCSPSPNHPSSVYAFAFVPVVKIDR